jgi:2-polyprenyl-6-methoxyphenol hydroxylase-like FAD-dependent oxidoreductase
VVVKAWEQVHAVGRRGVWQPRTALVTGGGPIGLLAAMLGVQQGLDVHVLDQVADGPKPQAVRALGATYHVGSVRDCGV